MFHRDKTQNNVIKASLWCGRAREKVRHDSEDLRPGYHLMHSVTSF